MEVHIKKVEIIPTRIKLNEPFVISKGALTHARNTVVIIHGSNGKFGTGECCPYRSIHGETQEGTVAIARDLAKMLMGRNVFEIEHHVQAMDRVITGNASIKCAFDMALYDLAAKSVELPLYRFLNGSSEKKIYTDMTVSLLEKTKMAEKAKKFVEDGFPVLKVKLGDRPASRDVERIAAIREAIGFEIPIRIDANQGWNYLEARHVLQELEAYNIEHCEEPIPAWNTKDQARLVAESPIPIMADEAVFDHRDAIQKIYADAMDLINIKLGKTGGICNAMKLVGIAEAAQMYCQVGSFSESRLGISALVHFAMVSNNIIYYDLDAPLMLSEDPVIGGLEYSDDWQVTVSDAPGHGASLDPAFLAKFERITIDN